MAERTTSINGTRVGDYIVRVLAGMAQGLFASLIIGLIIKQIGHYASLQMLERIGQVAQYMTGPAIGIGVALAIGVSPLGLVSCAVVGAVGAGTFVFSPDGSLAKVALGEPVGAMVASVFGAEVAKRISGKTGVDILLVPLATIILGSLVGIFVSPPIAAFMRLVGMFINQLTMLYPLPMGILVASVVGVVLTLPISSAAICISLGLNGLAAGAAVVGCCCQMVGFAVISYKDNGVGGLVSQGLGTSMLQIPNIWRNPRIWIPPTLASAILGPVSTMVFKMENTSAGAGMGTSGLVGQFNAVAAMGLQSLPIVILMHFFLPALLSLAIAMFMRKKNWIQDGDMRLKV